MIETITQHDLVQFVYQESENEKSLSLRNEIICDEGFAESYYQFKAVKEQLNNMVLSPQGDWAKNVLAYAQQKIKA